MKLSHFWRGLVATVLSLSVLSAQADVKDNTLRVGYQKSGGNFLFLKGQGLLEKRLNPLGFKVEWVEFPAGPQMLEGLNVGSIDVATVGETPPIFAQAAGANLLYIGHENATPAAEAILVPEQSAIKSVADLKGKKIALNKGSNVHYLLVKALEEANLSIRDIQPVYLKPSDARAAFQRGSVDAWVIWDPYLAAAQHDDRARVLRDGTGLVSNYQFYLASEPFAKRYPEVLNVVLEELDTVNQWVKHNLDTAVAELTPLVGLPDTVVRTALGRYNFGINRISDQVLYEQQRIADAFYNLKLIPKNIQVQGTGWTPASSSAHALSQK